MTDVTPQQPTPAGWYPDPWGAAPQRYWDGGQWTGYTAGAVAGAATNVGMVSERAAQSGGKLGRWGMIIAAVNGVLTPLAFTFIFAFFTTIDFGASSSSSSSNGMSGIGIALLALGQLTSLPLQFTGIAVLILLIMWAYRNARNGQALGIPARRTPGWAIGGWFIPIVNLWFPFESICDALPAERRPRVLRWWLMYLLAQLIVLPAVLIMLPLMFTGLWWLVLVIGLVVTLGSAALQWLHLRWGFEVADAIRDEQIAIAREQSLLTA